MRKFFKQISLLLVVSIILSGCGGNKTANSSKTDISKTEKNTTTTFTNDFKMDKKNRTGFMKSGKQYTSSPKDYIEINSVKELQNAIKSKHGKFILMKDLDTSETDWVSNDFNGILEGNYHIISGLNNSLVSKLTGTVKNLALENVNGIDASFAKNMNGGELYNCYATGKISGGGGLVSSIDLNYLNDKKTSVTIQYCYNSAKVTSLGEDSYKIKGIGGIAGIVNLSAIPNTFSVTIRNCENYGTLEGENPTAGIIGEICRGAALSGYYAESDLSFDVDTCFNYGEITGGKYAGGIIGELSSENASDYLKNTYNICKCANYGNVSIPKSNTSTYDDACGGIIGKIDTIAVKSNSMVTVNISDCLNTANVNNAQNEGGAICGLTSMNKGTCIISRCLGIGDHNNARDTNESRNGSTPIYNCTDYYSSATMSIAEMKNIQKNLPMFNYPYTWGINEYFCGFPHPYGDDELVSVQKYANEIQSKKTENLLKNSEEKDIILNQHYADALEMMCYGGYWPEDTKKTNYTPFLLMWSENPQTYFDILDIDKDGTNELLVKAQDYYYKIYSYDTTAKKLIKEYSCEGTDKWNKEQSANSKITWTLVKSENFSTYTDAYTLYYQQLLEKKLPQDVSLLYFKKIENLDKFIEDMNSNYNIKFKPTGTEEYCESIEGKYNGETAFSIFMEDGTPLYYTKKVQNITLYGIYPGMSKTEAEKIISEYGFYMGNYSYKMGNHLLTLDTKNDIVTSISIRAGSEYAG